MPNHPFTLIISQMEKYMSIRYKIEHHNRYLLSDGDEPLEKKAEE